MGALILELQALSVCTPCTFRTLSCIGLVQYTKICTPKLFLSQSWMLDSNLWEWSRSNAELGTGRKVKGTKTCGYAMMNWVLPWWPA